MRAAAAADDPVPVHRDSFAVLFLADAAEERGQFPFHRLVEEQVGPDDRNALGCLYLQGQRRLIAGGDLRAARKAPTLKAGDGEDVVALFQRNELLAIALDGIIPVKEHVLIVIGICHGFYPPVFQFRADLPASIISRIWGQYLMTQPVINFSPYMATGTSAV